ncbi:MAG: hypothetical protein R6X25_09400 [Candidatus Krumholzibacteriia bacterium]
MDTRTLPAPRGFQHPGAIREPRPARAAGVLRCRLVGFAAVALTAVGIVTAAPVRLVAATFPDAANHASTANDTAQAIKAESSSLVREIRAVADSAAAERRILTARLTAGDEVERAVAAAALARLERRVQVRILEIQRDHARRGGRESLALRMERTLESLRRNPPAPRLDVGDRRYGSSNP